MLQPGAAPYARSIAACFDAYLRPTETRFSVAV
jgi:oxygen-independent coproporphyrinogen-3 oxidase